MNANDATFTLRPARAEDLAWLAPFYERVMRPYVELTHEWDPTKFSEAFSPETTSIIQVQSRDIGMLKTEVRGDCIYLGDLQLDDAFRGREIGTAIINTVIRQANAQQLPVRLRVLKGNPAIGLYKRLGFVVTQTLDNCYEMESTEVQP